MGDAWRDGDGDDESLDASWRRRLAGVRLAAPDPRSRPRYRRRRVWYRLDPEESWRTGQLIVELFQQIQNRKGFWTDVLPVPLEREDPESFTEAEDRHLVNLLRATAPALQSEMRLAGRYTTPRTGIGISFVPAMLQDSVLPRLTATGRFFCSSPVIEGKGASMVIDGDQVPGQLAWDPRPWEFVVRILRSGDGVVVTGSLRRGGEVLPVTEAQAITDGAVVAADVVSPLAARGLSSWIWELREGGDIPVSESQVDAMLDELWNLPVLPAIEMPPEWPLHVTSVVPRPRLLVRAPRSPEARRLTATISFDYEGRRVAAHDRRMKLVDRAGQRIMERHEEAEEAAFDQLLELGAEEQAASDVVIEPEKLSALVFRLLDEGWLVEADGRPVRRGDTVRFSVSSGIDWFDLSGEAAFEGGVVLLPELLSAIRREERLVRLGDGTYGVLPEDWLERYTPLALFAEDWEDGAFAFQPGELVLLDALLEPEREVDVDRRFAEARARLATFRRLEPCREPAGFVGELRPYQREGLGWLRFLEDFGFGGCLADDMGLGKTVQVLALFELRRHEERARLPSLVVVPASLVHNWVYEAARFTPGLEALAYSGPGRRVWAGELARHDLVVTTYGTLRRDIEELAEIQFDYVVLDEAQAIKNVASQTAKACRRLEARHRLALTGTPVENHLGDLWSIFAFLNPGVFGRLPAIEAFAGKTRLDPASLDVLSRALRPFILRRTKEAVLDDLPEKTEQVLFCDLGERQEKLYDELREHYRLHFAERIEQQQGLEESKMEVFAALLRLRQAACHPGLIDEARRLEASAKLDVVLSLLEEILAEGHKALVFSQFTSFLAILRHHLDAAGVVYEYLDGRTRNRQQRVERFQSDDDCPLFLISLKAGGVGLNLTAADYVFLLDPWWNPAVEAQAIDRAHRIGQERPVFAYRLICRGTVEEKILDLQGKKRELADAILAADQSLIRTLTSEDLRWLLS